jgi:thiamine-monophosphate kinase
MLEEDKFIQEHFAPLSPLAGAHNLKDDVAQLNVPNGFKLVVTTDTVVEGVHFFKEDAPRAIAQKALRVNLSDLAAKGATPLAYFLNLCLPLKLDQGFISEFVEGLAIDQDSYGLLLYGGDTVRGLMPLTISITMMGTVPNGVDLARSKAKAGDHIVMTGTLGDAALGLKLRQNRVQADLWGLSAGDKTYLLRRYLLPQPRMTAGMALKSFANASMDISDGLMADCSRMGHASGLQATLNKADLPLSEAVAKALEHEPSLMQAIAAGGDDYEVLCAVSPAKMTEFAKAMQKSGCPFAVIGQFEAGEPGKTKLKQPDGSVLEFEQSGYSHL